MRALGADDGKPTRTPSAWMVSLVPPLPQNQAFGVDDGPCISFPVLDVADFSGALLGHSCQAPKSRGQLRADQARAGVHLAWAVR